MNAFNGGNPLGSGILFPPCIHNPGFSFLIQDLGLIILVGIDCTSKRLCWSVFFRSFHPERLRQPRKTRESQNQVFPASQWKNYRDGKIVEKSEFCRPLPTTLTTLADRAGGKITVWNTKRRTTANKSL
jgi:hypothetical protein